MSLPSSSGAPRPTPSARAGAPSYQTPGASLSNGTHPVHSQAGPRGRRDSMGGTSVGTGLSRSPTRSRRPELGRSDGPPHRRYRAPRQPSVVYSDAEQVRRHDGAAYVYVLYDDNY